MKTLPPHLKKLFENKEKIATFERAINKKQEYIVEEINCDEIFKIKKGEK